MAYIGNVPALQGITTEDITDFTITNADIAAGAAIDISKLNTTVTATELNYLSGVTSSVQSQINNINTDLVNDTTPQLGGNLDLNSYSITGTGTINFTGTVNGRNLTTDGTKLDGIESGATADQTGAEIKALYEAELDTNAFTDAEKTKLAGIEAGATGDQTAAEIRALVEAATDSNVFTDADHTKLNGIEAGADVTDTTNVTAAGALMDSELTNITAVKALNQGVATTDSPTFVTLNATTVDLGNWTVTESAGILYFATGGVNKMKLDASGNLTVTGDVTAYGTV